MADILQVDCSDEYQAAGQYRAGAVQSHGARGSYGAQVGVVLQEVFLQLGQDVLAVGVLPQGRDVGTDLVHQDLALAGLGHVYHLLDHVVGVLVLHHDVQGGGRTVTVHRAYLQIQI